MLLKDVFDYSLEETAELVESTVGGVKAALNRGRMKLAALPDQKQPPRAVNAETSEILRLYVQRFNQRDWDGLRELIAADATLRVADRFAGRLIDTSYFSNLMRFSPPLRLALADVDGQPVVLTLSGDGESWTPRSIVILDLSERRVVSIADYVHCPWVLQHADSVAVSLPTLRP